MLISLRRIIRAVDLHSKQLVHKHKLTGPQLIVLREIMRQENVTIGELAKRASLSNATVTGIVDRLEKRGLVVRSRGDKDRRQVLVSATTAADSVMAEAPPLLQEQFLVALEELDAGERSRMLESLERIARMMNAEGLDVAPVLSGDAINNEDGDRTATARRESTPANQNREESMKLTEEKRLYEDPNTGLRVHALDSEEQLPEWLNREQLVLFLHESLKPYEDSVEDIQRALDYVFNRDSGKGGFVLIGETDKKPLGSLVMLRTGMKGYIPENVLLFVAVAPEARGRGVGSVIIRRGFELAEGDVKLHVEYDNPAKRLYERLGMTSKYAEMRYNK